MKVQTIPNAWYVEALPSGEFAALAFSGVSLLTHLRPIDTPPVRGPLTVRITNVGGFKAIGQAQSGDWTLEWVDALQTWNVTSPGPFGVSGAIYDNNGVAQIATGPGGPTYVGSNGWRYVTDTNELVTGDATYSNAQYSINQYTVLPNGFLIGQNNWSGPDCLVVVTTDGVKRLLYTGSAEMPRVRWDRDGNVAVAFYLPTPISATAVILQTTYAELQSLPPVVSPTPEPPIPPQPEPPIPPDPTPIPPNPVPPIPPNPEPIMSTIPVSSMPVLEGTSEKSFSTRSALPSHALTAADYPWYENVMKTVPGDPGNTLAAYRQGLTQGYSALTGGEVPDIWLYDAMNKLGEATTSKNRVARVFGCMDIWRLLVEYGMNVQTVIDRM